MSKSMINNRFLEETVFAIADGYCVINLTKNYVPGVMYQVIDGRQYNLNEQLGLPEDSSLQSLVDAWALTIERRDRRNAFVRGRSKDHGRETWPAGRESLSGKPMQLF